MKVIGSGKNSAGWYVSVIEPDFSVLDPIASSCLGACRVMGTGPVLVAFSLEADYRAALERIS